MKPRSGAVVPTRDPSPQSFAGLMDWSVGLSRVDYTEWPEPLWATALAGDSVIRLRRPPTEGGDLWPRACGFPFQLLDQKGRHRCPRERAWPDLERSALRSFVSGGL